MMPKKEYYRGNLPHFQQPGQWYFITCVLQNAIPDRALKKYSAKAGTALIKYKNSLTCFSDPAEVLKFKREFLNLRKRYFFLLDKLINKRPNDQTILTSESNRKIMEEALKFWENKRLHSHAWCIMPNHIHWVVSIFKRNEKSEPVYLQDVLHSIKSYTAHKINFSEKTTGQLWLHESFDTTIRDDRHFYNVLDYTLNNPVTAGLVKNWMEWPGTFVEKGLI